jgi:RNA polymerase sigma-70 factor (sigma-E family)
VGLWGERQEEPVDAATWIDAALPRLMGAALSLTGHRHDAEDLVQETLAKVVLKWSSVNHADSPDAYVRRAMVNTFISGKRRKSSREVVSHDVVTAEWRGREYRHAGHGHDSDLAARDHMWQLLATLPPRQRAVLVLRYYDDLPDAQIAEVLGCSAVSVRVAAHRAMGTLREALSPEAAEPAVEVAAKRA